MANGRAPDGMVVIQYRAWIPRFKGGAITRGGGYIIHTFSTSDLFSKRWWARRSVAVEYIIVGGAGGANGPNPGGPGQSASGISIVESSILNIKIGQGGQEGNGGHGGNSSIDGTRI